MFYGKKKAITFSYDDGVEQDVRFIEILNKYGLRATFNLNSELLGLPGELIREGVKVGYNKISPDKVREIYSGHEVAVHTLTHPFLPSLDDGEVVRQVEEDRKNLSRLVGYDVVGMAYPCGGENNDDRVASLIKNHTGVKYARTITLDKSFSRRSNLFRFNPTAYHVEYEENFRLLEEFLKPETEGLFYVWGHTYEFDIHNTWGIFEEFCRALAFREDVFYGTNKEVLLI